MKPIKIHFEYQDTEKDAARELQCKNPLPLNEIDKPSPTVNIAGIIERPLARFWIDPVAPTEDNSEGSFYQFKCYDTILRQTYAAKCSLDLNGKVDNENTHAASRFLAHMYTTTKAFTPRIIDLALHKDILFSIEEPIPGPTIIQVLEKHKTVSLNNAVKFCTDILERVDMINTAGLAVTNPKLSNFVVDTERRCIRLRELGNAPLQNPNTNIEIITPTIKIILNSIQNKQLGKTAATRVVNFAKHFKDDYTGFAQAATNYLKYLLADEKK